MLHFVQQPVANFDVVPPLRTDVYSGPITNAPNNANEPNQTRFLFIVTSSFHTLSFFFLNLLLIKKIYFFLNLCPNYGKMSRGNT